ncbi:hypothetical protein [Pseudomonas sp. CGJS7]|uniref:hypothetical protein n=1 Tax=Pseudomonas sp. CGJS7 TaxID=3109348 RepID=UPI00300BEAF9
MTEQYARDALRMRMLLDQLVIADAAKNEVSARRLAAEIASLRELWAENTGVRIKYSRFKVIDPGGGEHSAIAPLPATNAEVMAQIDVDKRDANNWASFSRYCIEELRIHANGELLRSRTKEWIRSSVLGGFLPPLIFLVFGALVSWIWRGFRPNKPA